MTPHLLYREHIILVKRDERLEGKFVCYWHNGCRYIKLSQVVGYIDRELAKLGL